MKLLSKSAKTEKTEAGVNVQYAMLYLEPSMDYKSICAGSTKGCRASCLTNSGMMRMPTQTAARVERTKFYLDNPEAFKALLHVEIKAFIKACDKKGIQPALRLNGTSDIDWSEFYGAYPMIQFQEYTKVYSRANKMNYPNLNITYSRSERMRDDTLQRLVSTGHQVAVVFNVGRSASLPETFKGIPVIDADQHDARWTEDSKSIAGLRVKGTNVAKKAAIDTGFAVTLG